MKNKEVEYLSGLLNSFDPEKYEFRLGWTEGKQIIGVVNKSNDKSLSNLYKYETFYRTLINLDEKICYSLKKGIEYSYSDEVLNDYNMFTISSKQEKLALYYIENAIFRTSTLWDILAQIYNIYCDIGLANNNIYYQQFFKNKLKDVELEVKSNVGKINNYLEETENTDCEGFWKGNHEYIRTYRNQMTHRNAPEEYSFSDIGISLKSHPSLLLKRVIEDYYLATSFVDEILQMIHKQYFE
ncbi:Cthe_2314 family HEPN domain-containing protein [Clostridium algidicarnis]|uniref:Cthe_2314 family HEPN domain-containing protein n=1 Tax=Clostridium algidicarnis TaxID=37659 RepID=UPI001C0E0745|nr:Cthe_2314 family HEPN domain-containing protein [Clostridium algidicarnis]MBU3205224.1 hypothetical protein [Clostridium algidicarnis]MBU3213377.1 hypothetical protein [Clostridium algidicarnis]MBU3223320.1 hypothetical protein [Clostridium algidicarnis]